MAIDTAFHYGFQNQFEVKFQQMGSRLRPFVTERPQNVEREFYDRIGTVNVTERTVRHGPTIGTDADHTRIACMITDYRPDALFFDSEDSLRMKLSDPRNGYAETQAYALGRKMDQVIIEAAIGTTYTGKLGTTAETYSTATYGVAVNAVAPGATPTNTNLTVEKLIRARSRLASSEAIMDGEPVVFVCSQSQIDSLLRTTQLTDADYNTVRTLVAGQINSYMGFNFVRTELLPKTGNIRTCLAFPKSAIILGVADAKRVRIDERPDLNYTWQVWTQGTFGAVRTWREKVVAVECDETA